MHEEIIKEIKTKIINCKTVTAQIKVLLIKTGDNRFLRKRAREKTFRMEGG
jgi:hypothetical protein